MATDPAVTKEIDEWLERHAKELGLKSVPERMRKGVYRHPVYSQAYRQWRDAVIMTDGALSRKEKLLIATGIVAHTRVEAAIRTYAKMALVAGATKEQVIEAMYCAAPFMGGPGLGVIMSVVDVLESGKELYPGV